MKNNLRQILLFIFALYTLGSIASPAQDTAKSRITVASNVRVRSLPNTTADEVAKLPIGVVVRQLEQSSTKERIANNEDYWYKVATLDGKEGWLFGSFTAPFDARNKAAIYKQIAADRLKIESMNFVDWADLSRFLTSAATEVTDKEALPWIELARLLAMRNAAATMPIDKQNQPPFQPWLKANESNLIYSDPAGQWFVKAELFWNLHKKYSTLAIADQIAWEAANISLGGECEGYVPCNVSRLNVTTGRYLKLYPQGAHSGEALDQMQEELQSLIDYHKSEEDKPNTDERKEALPEFAILRTTLTKVTNAKKARVAQTLTQLESRYR
jgi:hypothetical protein